MRDLYLSSLNTREVKINTAVYNPTLVGMLETEHYNFVGSQHCIAVSSHSFFIVGYIFELSRIVVAPFIRTIFLWLLLCQILNIGIIIILLML